MTHPHASFPVESPVALITGAGSGIGLCTARLLARTGFTIALVGRDRTKLDAARSTLRDAGRHLVLTADLRDAARAELVMDTCVDALGRIDVLINNAGASPLATIPQTTREIAQEVFALNAVTPTVLIARAWRHFERQAVAARAAGKPPRAVVVNVSSMATKDPFDGLYAYAAAKASVNLLALSVAKQGGEIAAKGFAVAPGAVETPLLRSLFDEHQLPRERTLDPDAVAAVIERCVLGGCDDANGTTLYVEK